MNWSHIKNPKTGPKLFGGFLLVVAIFCASGIYTLNKVSSVSEKSSKFINEYFPTVDLIRETQIMTDEITFTVLLPPEDLDTENFITTAESDLAERATLLSHANLEKKDANRIIQQLSNLKRHIATPIRDYERPRLALRAADNSAKVLRKVLDGFDSDKLRKPVIAAIDAYQIMAETGDLGQYDAYIQNIEELAKHPFMKFDEISPLFQTFVEAGERVFDGAMDFQMNMYFFNFYRERLSQALTGTKKHYSEDVVAASAKDIMASLGSVTTAQGGSMIIASMLALILAFFLTRAITKPLKNAIRILSALNQGEIPEETLSSGTPVNCSAAKDCGKKECPSYGKVDPCWATAGSFAMIKHCPQAQNGEDCRTCNLYTAHNEIEELGSIVTALTNGMRERVEAATIIAKGDLSHEIPLAADNDRLGRALQDMQGSLAQMIGEVQSSASQIASRSAQVADASQSLSQGATEQASSLEEIAASMQEISGQIRTSADNATQANLLTKEASHAAETGNEQMNDMVAAMNDINEASTSISKIIRTIDEIAFQTNLLALNAAVEAARAGQHGKGFAVVAEEVRNLAARSAKAAKETEELIAGAVGKTNRGTELASHTAESLKLIVQAITKVSDLVGEINVASNEQAQGISQVTQGISQIDQVTQQNTANAEESAAASEELSSQAGQMQQMLERFTLNNKNVRRVSSPSQASPPKRNSVPSLPWGEWGASAFNRRSPINIDLADREFGRD